MPSLSRATFRHTLITTTRVLATLSFLSVGHVIADETPTYPENYMQSHPQTQQAFQQAIQPIQSQHRWITHYGTASPVGKYEQDGLIYTVLTGCKPHDCSTERYVALVDIHSNVRGVLAHHNQRADGTASTTTLNWFGKVDDRAQMLILKAYTEAE